MAEEIGNGNVTEQSVINELTYLHSVVTSAIANRVAAKYRLPLKQAIPVKLGADQHPRLSACLSKLTQEHLPPP